MVHLDSNSLARSWWLNVQWPLVIWWRTTGHWLGLDAYKDPDSLLLVNVASATLGAFSAIHTLIHTIPCTAAKMSEHLHALVILFCRQSSGNHHLSLTSDIAIDSQSLFFGAISSTEYILGIELQHGGSPPRSQACCKCKPWSSYSNPTLVAPVAVQPQSLIPFLQHRLLLAKCTPCSHPWSTAFPETISTSVQRIHHKASPTRPKSTLRLPVVQ